ncbi:hypothetical protein KKP06_22035 [Ralstonia pickettii]|uniref:hypothetical protein n=1 Tax=Ralstonia pickettii TaxID=329 RepID=UPI001BE448A0|nr:hypothetical protein [Ralstonia pickettii]MBT2180499.1 hypothetical protein [Ralstonia pickettii]
MDTVVLDGIAAEEVAESAEQAAQATAAQAAEQQQQQQENADGWRQAVRAAGDIVTSALPEAKPVWTGERMDNLGDALARCDEQYGWGGAGALFSHPLIGLAVAAFPLALGTVKVLKDVREKEVAKGAPAAMAKPIPPSEQPDVTLAQPVAA